MAADKFDVAIGGCSLFGHADPVYRSYQSTVDPEGLMDDPFTPQELDDLSTKIDEQLRALGAPGTGLAKGRKPAEALGETQRQAIERATGEDAMTFLARFKQAARKDVCRPGGIIHTQWEKWKDVANKDLIKTFGAILVGMGLSGSALHIVVVAVAVYVLYLGLEAFCKGG
jgi:hypothetical protein